jgi:nitrate reductase alpha subunit
VWFLVEAGQKLISQINTKDNQYVELGNSNGSYVMRIVKLTARIMCLKGIVVAHMAIHLDPC